MATIAPVESSPQGFGYIVFTWTLSDGDDGTPVQLGEYVDRSVQIGGDFGTGGQVTLEGSNNLVLGYEPLTDLQGNVLSGIAAKGLEQISEAVAYMRPRVVAGTGVEIAVSLFVRLKG